MSRRFSVLVQAYACNPKYGSEEGVGWGWVTAISKHHDLHVLTAEYHRDDIEEALEAEPALRDRLNFHYVPQRAWHYRPTPMWKSIEASIAKPIMLSAYRSWQRGAYELAKSLSSTVRFDLVHVITYVGFRFPGPYWKMPLPLVWGPIGGLENTPWRYLPALGLAGSVKFAGRNIINSVHRRVLPGPKKAFAKARGGIIAATGRIREEISRFYGEDSIVRCEIGAVAVADGKQPHERSSNEPLQIIWSAIHANFKALPLLLDALARLDSGIDWHLTVLGDGPETERWQRRARQLRIADRVDWTGRISRTDAIERMSRSHVMVITSLHDLTSSVLIEALSVGLPVICPDHYGFRDAVDESCGVKVSTASLDEISRGIGSALRALYEDEPARRQMARGALEKSRGYSWEETGALVSRIYRSQLGE